MTRRLLVMGGHEFDRLDGNEAICDHIVQLAGGGAPKVCLLPTASGDPEDQISRFRRSFGSRGCDVSDISLFRLGANPIDVAEHLRRQDAIYVGGGSLVNLTAVWRAHGMAEMIESCLDEGVLVVGQSAGAMCWFQAGITSSSGRPEPAPGLGLIDESLCVHYHRDPERRTRFLAEVAAGGMPAGYGADDQAGILWEDQEIVEIFSAREGARVWRVDQAGSAAVETELGFVDIRPESKPEAGLSAVDDFRSLNTWRNSARLG